MALEAALQVFLPVMLLALALAFDSRVFGFFGGVSAFFVGLVFITETAWLGIIMIALGLYFVVASVFMED